MYYREFGFVLCVVAFVCATPIQPKAGKTGPPLFPKPDSDSDSAKTSEARRSGSVHSQDHLALPSGVSYRTTTAPTPQYQRQSYQADSAVVDTISEPVTPRTVYVQSHGTASNANRQNVFFTTSVASDPSSPEYNNILERYAPPVEPIQPYYAVPVAPKTVTIGAHNQDIRPILVYANNAIPAKKFYTIPIGTENRVTVEPRGAVNIQPLFYSSQNAPLVSYANNAVTARPIYAVPISENSPSSEASQSVRSFPVNLVQTNSPLPQYVPIQRFAYNVNPTVQPVVVTPSVTPKTVTEEEYNSVNAYPTPAPKYATGPAFIRYTPIPVPVSNPTPVPVIYHSSTAPTQQPSAQRYVWSNAVAPTRASYVQVPVRAEQIPEDRDEARPSYVQIPYRSQQVSNRNGAEVQYNPVHVVHSPSFVEKVYTPVVSTTPATPTGQENGNARFVYSPASEVSRVTFNGLGVSYGW